MKFCCLASLRCLRAAAPDILGVPRRVPPAACLSPDSAPDTSYAYGGHTLIPDGLFDSYR